MGTKLYDQDETGIRFVSERRPGDVRIPNYVYDLWMPLLGSDAIGVYAVYCRLEREDVVKAMSLKRIAAMCRIGTGKLDKINADLARCGFVRVSKPRGHERLMHWTTEITVLDPPMEICQELIEEYEPPSGYEPLSPWLVSPETPNGSSGDAKQGLDTDPNGSSKVETLDLKPCDVESRAGARSTNSSPGDVIEFTFTDGDEPTRECPKCKARINLTRLSPSAGKCPGCGAPVRVKDEDGCVIIKIPQAARAREDGLGPWLPAVRAFCQLSPNIHYGKLPAKLRGQWARELRELAGDDGPEEFAKTIPKLYDYVWQIEALTSPFQDRFARAVLDYRMNAPGGNINLDEPTGVGCLVIPDW